MPPRRSCTALSLASTPIQSLQRIILIHGMPSLEARTMVALLKACGYRIRVTFSQSDESTVVSVDLDGEAYESTWTIERARKAGYVPEIDQKTGGHKTNDNGKIKGNEKYLTDPQAMPKAKAQSGGLPRYGTPMCCWVFLHQRRVAALRTGTTARELACAQVQKLQGRGAAITVDDIMSGRGRP